MIIRLLVLVSLLGIKGALMAADIFYIDHKKLKIPVVFEQQSSLPTYTMQLVFKNSGSIQNGSKAGLASLTARLLNEGTKKKGNIKFSELLESNAINLNASSGFETFVIELSSLKERRVKALQLLKDLLLDPNYTQESFQKIKTIQTGLIQRKKNDFDYTANVALKKLLYANTPLEKPSLGTLQSIKKIELEDIQSFIQKNLILENLIIAAGGDITLSELKHNVSDLLTGIHQGKAKTLVQFKPSDKKKSITIEKKTQQAYIYFGAPFDAKPDDKDAFLAKVASFILGGSGFGSRLMEEIRVKRGLAYSAYGNISLNNSYSSFSGYLQTQLENTKEAKRLVTTIVQDFVKKGVSQKELDGAKRFLMGSEPLRTETLSQRLNRSFMLYYRGLDPDHISKELKMIDRLTLEELNAYIKSHSEINALSFAVVKD